jgi:hypothetical protein
MSNAADLKTLLRYGFAGGLRRSVARHPSLKSMLDKRIAGAVASQLDRLNLCVLGVGDKRRPLFR